MNFTIANVLLSRRVLVKIVIQKVLQSGVEVDGKLVSTIKKGVLCFVGIGIDDSRDQFDFFIKKILNLRIFGNLLGKMDKSILDFGFEVLLVSQFTLYADCKKGNRPSFCKAMSSDKAEELYNSFVDQFRKSYSMEKVKDGVFGSDMIVNLVNDGPVTIILES
jgi:D-aminoacyl-tRNA deacylase